MDPFEIGDPYIEWNEENSAKEESEKDYTAELVARLGEDYTPLPKGSWLQEENYNEEKSDGYC